MRRIGRSMTPVHISHCFCWNRFILKTITLYFKNNFWSF